MTLIRTVLFFAAALLLGGGYLASQVAFFSSMYPQTANATVEYAAKIDVPQVKIIALILLIACVVLAFVPIKEEAAD